MMSSADLRDRLKGMLIDTPPIVSSSASRPLIQVLGSEDGKASQQESSTGQTVRDVADEEGEDPPPIYFSADQMPDSNIDATSSLHHSSTIVKNKPDTLSLAEQLLADAALANEERQKQQTQREKLSAKRSTFGVKRGFLNSSSSKVNRKGKAATREVSKHKSKKEESKAEAEAVHPSSGKQDELIYELDNDGNIMPSPSSSSDGRQSQGRNPLHLTEVQSAMLSHLESNVNLWAKPDLLDTITKHHPKLARGMNDPRYVSALQAMQTNPKETLENLKNNSPEIVDWLKEFCGVMGEHFVRLGEEQARENNNMGAVEGTKNDAKIREIGPLEKKALKMHMEATKDGSGQESTQQMNERVSSILANDELRSILMDPVMQQILEDCSNGNKIRYYMGDAEIGPKLRKLLDAGLIRLA